MQVQPATHRRDSGLQRGRELSRAVARNCFQHQTPFTAIVVYDFDADNTVPVVQEIIASGETRLTLRGMLTAAA